jgi:nucleotidyltransferase substrate binding protein (TIGR01987 family)
MDVDFEKLDKALGSLRSALSQPPRNDLERDGVIQRFEYCFELLWKTSKRALKSFGVESASPRSVIRDLARQGFITDAEEWMMLLEARNYTSHTYNEITAQWVFSKCSVFLLLAGELIQKLKAERTS